MSFRAGIPAAMVAWALLFASPAQADVAERCVEATDRGQQLRDEGKLVMAKQALATCAAAACPSVVRRDCSKWLADVEERLPSIIVSARDESGRDLVATRVVIDGKLVTLRLEGKELPIDPGEHTLRFEPDGYVPLEQTIVAREREKGRVIDVRPRRPASTEPQPVATHPPPPADPSGVPALAWVAGGVAVVGLAGFAYFYASGVARRDELRETCGGACTSDQVSEVKTKNALALVSGGVGVLAAAAAVGLVVMRPDRAASIGPVPGGALASVTWGF